MTWPIPLMIWFFIGGMSGLLVIYRLIPLKAKEIPEVLLVFVFCVVLGPITGAIYVVVRLLGKDRP